MVRRLYTPDLANRSLPLVRRIAADVRAIARRLQELWPARQQNPDDGDLQDEFDGLRSRFGELLDELVQLDVELEDPLTGLLDFKARREGGEVVYLCWRLGEDSVDHWHTIDSGLAGRRPLVEF